MARILAISSEVACGTVGLSVIVPALQALGHDVLALPTVVLSNHPGHAHIAGTRLSAALLHDMLDALDGNGWLAGLDAVLTGYLPTPEHVAFAAAAVMRVRAIAAADGSSSGVLYVCDPVLGDDPKGLYIEASAAAAVRDRLVPMADVVTPNRFELSFLTGRDVRSVADVGHDLPCAATIATSIPSADGDALCNVLAIAEACLVATVPRRTRAPHGTGDLLSALVLSSWLDRPDRPGDTLGYATAGVDFALDGSLDPDAIAVAALPLAATPLSWPVAARPVTAGRTPSAV